MIVGTQCTSGRTLNTYFDLYRRRSRKTLLTEYGAASGEMHNIKVMENFKTFPEIINTPLYNQWLRSYDYCRLGVLLEMPAFWTDQLSG
jgi:hypothetical protein